MDTLPIGVAGEGVLGIDPTAAEAAGITDIKKACAWSGITGTQFDAFAAVTGEPRLLRELVFMPLAEFETATSIASTPGAAATDPSVLFTTIVRGRFVSLRRVARMRCGLTPGEVGAAAQQALVVAGGGAQLGPQASASTSLKIKLSSLVDQSLDVELVEISPAIIRTKFKDYASRHGDFPADYCEPSGDQVSALGQLLVTDRVPYVNFSLWGPFGRRLLAKLVFVAMVLSSGGEWIRRELPGPPDWTHWWASWRVLRVAFLLWQAVEIEHLDNYAENLRQLAETYPSCWFIVYGADCKMRSERFEQLRRNLEAHPVPSNPVDVARPWNSVFKAANSDAAFWDIEVRHACLAHLTRISAPEAYGGRTAQPDLAPSGGIIEPPAKKQRPREPDAAGPPVHNKNGVPLCADYNAGRCHGTCPLKLAHQCSLCLQTHPTMDHDKRPIANGGEPRSKKADNRKGGKRGKGR
jgi:hypothetical protein